MRAWVVGSFVLLACGSDGTNEEAEPSPAPSEPSKSMDPALPSPPPPATSSTTAVNDAGAPPIVANPDAGSEADAAPPPTSGDCFVAEVVAEDAFPIAINARGQVVGNAFMDGGTRAFVWTDGVRVDLPMEYALAMNDGGDVVGVSAGHGVLWRDGQAITLGDFGGDGSSAGKINAAGHVVGWALVSDALTRAALWKDATPTNLGALSDGDVFSGGAGISDTDQVLGRSGQSGGGDKRLFLWENGVVTDLNGEDGAINGRGDVLVVRGERAFFRANGSETEVRPFADVTAVRLRGLTPAGIVFGAAEHGGAYEAFLWSNGQTTTLSAGFNILGANDAMAAAGGLEGGPSGDDQRAAVWKNGKLVVLEPAAPHGSYALDINASHQAVGEVGLATKRVVKRWSTGGCFP